MLSLLGAGSLRFRNSPRAADAFNKHYEVCHLGARGLVITKEGNRMKLNLIVMAVIASTSMLASAQTTTKSREEVKAEAVEALKSGDLKCGNMESFPEETGKSTTSRAEVVKAAKVSNLKCGDLEAYSKDTTKSTKPRAAVKDDAKAALKAGAIKAGEK